MDEEQKRMLSAATDAILMLANEVAKLRPDIRDLRAVVELLNMRLDRGDHAAE